MPLFANRLIALFAAYGLVCAIFLGSVAAGQLAASPTAICHVTASGTPGSSPVAPQDRDLACLVIGCCCGLSAASPVPAPFAVAASFAYSRIVWANAISRPAGPDIFTSFSARAPPLPI